MATPGQTWNPLGPIPNVPNLGTVGALVPSVVQKFGNRQDLNSTDDGSPAVVAILESVAELTETYEFEELKYRAPIQQMVQGQSEYPISGLIAGNPIGAVDITKMFTLTFWFQGQVNAVRNLKYRRYPTAVMYSFGLGGISNIDTPPIYWSRYNNNISFAPAPDQNYYFFTMEQLRHPTPTTNQAEQLIYMPASWGDIVAYSAALRLATNEGAESYVDTFERLLRGDPKTGQPGLIFGRVPQMERDEMMNERQLSLAIMRYTYGRV
ncbi:MAG: hypothetical protein ACYCOU_15915 [Sulfobacillus sp.]